MQTYAQTLYYKHKARELLRLCVSPDDLMESFFNLVDEIEEADKYGCGDELIKGIFHCRSLEHFNMKQRNEIIKIFKPDNFSPDKLNAILEQMVYLMYREEGCKRSMSIELGLTVGLNQLN